MYQTRLHIRRVRCRWPTFSPQTVVGFSILDRLRKRIPHISAPGACRPRCFLMETFISEAQLHSTSSLSILTNRLTNNGPPRLLR